jgi:hypothetical protein
MTNENHNEISCTFIALAKNSRADGSKCCEEYRETGEDVI